MKKVLIVSGDVNLSTTIAGSLEMKKMIVFYSDGRNNVFEMFERLQPNIVLLDVLIGGIKAGFEIAKKIREVCYTPIIFITVLDAPEDLTKAFSFENVDYINKPFNIIEVLLRIDKMLSGRSRYNYYQLGSFTFYPDESSLVYSDKSIHLNNCETAVLTVLCKHIDSFVSRSEISSTVWGVDDCKLKEGSLNNVISRLRKHLSKEPRVKIESIIKVGVKLFVYGALT